jgi:hypothetical protein
MVQNFPGQAGCNGFFKNKAQTFFPYPAITTIIYKDCAAPVQ